MALMYYIIYRITNKNNNQIYIGSHKTNNKDDGYMGSGKYLKNAINKYGVENFLKEIIFIFDNAKDMYDKESEIVNDIFLAEENTYNLKLGGQGGWDYVNSPGFDNPTHAPEHMRGMAATYKSICADDPSVKPRVSRKLSLIMKDRIKNDTEYAEALQVRLRMMHDSQVRYTEATGGYLAHTPEATAKRKQTYDNIGHQQGMSNSQYGTCWITKDGVNKKIKTDILGVYLTQGWLRVRQGRQ